MSFARWLWRRSAGGADEVYVTERAGVRSLHIGSDTIQSSMRLARPNDLELAYTRSMMAFLLFFLRSPRNVLMIGLGGGSLAKFVYHRFPEARIDAIELNPRVVAIARSSFCVPDDDERFTVRLADGAQWVARSDVAADAILVDGYDGASQAPELSTRHFYDHCRSRLASGGALVVNLWGNDRRFAQFLGRIEAAFPGETLCLPAERPGNIIIFGLKDGPSVHNWGELETRARGLQSQYNLEFDRFVSDLRKMNRCNAECLFSGPARQGACAGA